MYNVRNLQHCNIYSVPKYHAIVLSLHLFGWWLWSSFCSCFCLENVYFCIVQSSDSLQPLWTAAHQASLSFTISPSLLKLMLAMPSNYLILCHPLLLLPSILPSIRVFSNESVLHITWPKYCSFSISPSNEYLGLISFLIDWFDLLAVQGTLKSLL